MTLTKEQLAQRKHGVTATDFVAIIGASKYRTALDVAREKLGIPNPEPSERLKEQAHIGQCLEYPIMEMYRLWLADPENYHIVPGKTTVSGHWMATPDFLVEREGEGLPRTWLLECKNRSAYSEEAWVQPDGEYFPPPDVFAQVQWQMHVTGCKRCDVAVLFGGNKFRVITVHYDEVFLDNNIAKAIGFYGRVIVKKQLPEAPPPPPPLTDIVVLGGTHYIIDKIKAVAVRAPVVKSVTEEQARDKQTITAFMRGEGAKTLLADGVTANLVEVAGRESVDWEAMALAFKPSTAMIAKYTKRGASYTRLTVQSKPVDTKGFDPKGFTKKKKTKTKKAGK